MGIRARRKRFQWVSYWIPYPNTRRKHREPEEFIIYNTKQIKYETPNKKTKNIKKREKKKKGERGRTL